jgi:hypothetical protein
LLIPIFFAYAQPVFVLISLIFALMHHATAVQYDVSKTVSIRGQVARIDWANPHIHVYLNVKTGKAEEAWNVEFPSPGAAIVAGLSKQLLSPGASLTVEAYPSKSAPVEAKLPRLACAKTLTLADGTHFTFVVGI